MGHEARREKEDGSLSQDMPENQKTNKVRNNHARRAVNKNNLLF